MKIDVITLFPAMILPLVNESIVKRAVESNLVKIDLHYLRDWGLGKYRQVDDRPYGGGPGMVLKVDVLHKAIQDLKKNNPQALVVLLTPQGKKYSQPLAKKLSQKKGLILIAGHYEGFDDRVRNYVDLEISIGDYILTGGEIPALVVIDSVVRLIPGVLGDDQSAIQDSFCDQLLDHPQFTRPEKYDGQDVPSVLLSGNHLAIKKWRQKQALLRTKQRRPDLIIHKTVD
jgi:tRNA (guanine37-N1)-methyltransferase